MIGPALILHWMTTLAPHESFASTFPETANAIAETANLDKDPIDAAATLTAIGFFESHFNPGAISKLEDGTHSYGVFQLSIQWIRPPAPIRSQAYLALLLARDSKARCGTLAMYASGSCDDGLSEASARAKLAAKLKIRIYVEVNIRFRKRNHG